MRLLGVVLEMYQYNFALITVDVYVNKSGGVAHMVERSLRMREARGSIPRTSIFKCNFAHCFRLIERVFVTSGERKWELFSLSICLY